MQNLEAKFRLDDLERAAKQAEGIGYRFRATVLQCDTFFRVPAGKLKLREEGSEAWISATRRRRPASMCSEARTLK